MTAIEGSLDQSNHQEQPDSGSQWRRLRLWAAERRKYWLILLVAGALAAVAAVVLGLTLGGSGKSSGGADDSGSSNFFSPAATAVPGDFSREIALSGGALTVVTSQTSRADGRFFDAEDGGRLPAPTAFAEPQSGEPDSFLATTQRQVISQATLSVEVAQVASAVDQVRAIAESLGGFVEQLSSSGVAQEQHSTLTIRVPQTEFFNAFDRIKLLGEVVSENAGSEDVTEQFIDLEARLKSAQREEESLLSLLGRADKVGDILTIERELVRVRTDLERWQGQINFLERRVDLATITVSLFAPQARLSEPPSASIELESTEVTRRVEEAKALIVSVGGEVDQVFTSVRDGRVRASLTARVFAKDFDRVLVSIESQGEVVSKDVREGSTLPNDEVSETETPRSVIDISLVEPEPSGTNLALAAGAPAGGVAFAALLALLIYAAYRTGRRRSPEQS
jgi:hypothetical protein